jgi:hypothetical protein
MAFIPQKSTFLEEGWKDEDLALFKELFPFEVSWVFFKTKLLYKG